MTKTLHNTDSNGAKKNVSDLIIWGNGDTFKLICKASSEKEGWMKSTKAMEISGIGCVVQVTTQQRNRIWNGNAYADESYTIAETITFVPHVRIIEHTDILGKIIAREIISLDIDSIGISRIKEKYKELNIKS